MPDQTPGPYPYVLTSYQGGGAPHCGAIGNHDAHVVAAGDGPHPGASFQCVGGPLRSVDQPCLYQQARIALRDRLGIEPTAPRIDAVARRMRDSNMIAHEAVNAVLRSEGAPNVTYRKPTPTTLSDVQERLVHDQAIAFAQSYLTMDRERIAAREKVRTLDAEMDGLVKHPAVREVTHQANRYHAVYGALNRLTRELEAAKNDERIAAWNQVVKHPLFEGVWQHEDDDQHLVDTIIGRLDYAARAVREVATTIGSSVDASRVAAGPAPAQGFGVAVSRDGESHAVTVDSDDAGAAGLARLRAHSALDSILDQLGITR